MVTEPKNGTVDWHSIEWDKVSKTVRKLRQRIYRAVRCGEWKQVRNLQKLMLRSLSNTLLSVRRVTQENQGKDTPGIDGIKSLNPGQKVNLVNELMEHQPYKVKPTKRVYIPKSNGKKRPLGIPVIKDRAMQAVVKNALEPEWEANFEANSYGFRPGRGCHDAIEQCHNRLRERADTWILDADIKGAFDNISHKFLLGKLENTPGRQLIKQWLKAGHIEQEVFHKTESGTPQGGVISPLLANIAFDGIDSILSQFKKVKVSKKLEGTRQRKFNKYGFVRYADDFVITAEVKEDLEAVIPIIEIWLAHRGLTLSKEKTQIVNIEQGFDFLGFNVRQFKGKCLIKPSKEKVKSLLGKVREWLNSHKTAKPEVVINHLNPLLRGWGNYYRHGVSKEVFSYVDHEIFKALWRWAKRRHPRKGKRWIKAKYFKTVGNQNWTFAEIVNGRREGEKKLISLIKLSEIQITRHIKVKDTASPDDPSLSEYWGKRKTTEGKTYWSKGSSYYKVAMNQNWKCPECREHLINGEKLHTHHIVGVKDGGDDEIDNLIHLHKSCHISLHNKKVTQ